jgi:hypothetical protein
MENISQKEILLLALCSELCNNEIIFAVGLRDLCMQNDTFKMKTEVLKTSKIAFRNYLIY